MNPSESTVALEELFERASETYDVPLNLILAVAKAESNFNPDAVSRCGAQGIMQLMPSTASSLGVTDSFNAEQNIMGGAKLLSRLLSKYDGDTELALAAYNAGSGAVDTYDGIPPYEETQQYVIKVMDYAEQTIAVPDAVVPSTDSISSSTNNDLYRLLAAQIQTSALSGAFNYNDSSDGYSSLFGTSGTTTDYSTFLNLLSGTNSASSTTDYLNTLLGTNSLTSTSTDSSYYSTVLNLLSEFGGTNYTGNSLSSLMSSDSLTGTFGSYTSDLQQILSNTEDVEGNTDAIQTLLSIAALESSSESDSSDSFFGDTVSSAAYESMLGF
jgi:hypothetical protein